MENFDLFTKMDLSDDDFVNPSESAEPKTKNEETTVASINLFGSAPVPIVPEAKKESTPVAPKEEKEAPVVQVKKVVPKTKAKSASKGSSELANKLKEQKKKKEDVTITPEWTVAYSAQQYHVPHDMKLEDVRQWLELDYPELSKERCMWDVDEPKKLLVPIVSGAKMG